MWFVKLCLVALIFAVNTEGQGSDLSTCGKVKDLDPETFIVGGSKAQDGEWPWQAALFRAGRRICGASLVHPEWILTAAHCIDVVTNPSMFQFLMGVNKLNSSLKIEDYDGSTAQRRNVTGVFVHPEYRPYRHDHDIALLKLESPFDIDSDYVTTICIPSHDATYIDGEMCTVTGWGSTSFGGSQNPDLFEVEVPIVNQDECEENYQPSPISDDMICAGKTGLDSCQGDSGGPMVTKDGDNWVQVGVVSWGQGCGFESYPGVYARVTYFADWIDPIFHDGEPEKLNGTECSEGEFLCEGGYCIEYASKCDGSNTCYFGTDERYCNTYERYFDYKIGVKLTVSTVVDAASLNECAKKCLEYEDFNCIQFDFFNGTTPKCKLGSSLDSNEVNNDDDTLMHFELQYFKGDGGVLTQKSGAIASPAWTSSTSVGPWYSWIIQINSMSVNAIDIDFDVVSPSTSECSGKENMIIVRAGTESNSKPVEASCIEMMESIRVDGTEARLDFYTVNTTKYKFIASYGAVWSCDNIFTEEGIVTSPKYPDNYPNGATCRTLIEAPEGMTIQLQINDFNLEKDGDVIGVCESDFDTLSIYDGKDDNTEDMEWYGEYCGNMINKTFISSSNYTYLVFKSDSSATEKGFKATFTFLTDEIPEHEKQINELTDSLNGYKFGLAGLFVFCLLSILVLSMSLYTVTSRETKMYDEYMEEKLKAETRLDESNNRNSTIETQTPEGQVNYGQD
ncbi:uncharacterized protein [Antedon mediterranea]|uniref:uncharacterized protein n=1 Tax=Antedon mediterranea TaxID=105859 RepID=UPI003AF5F000